MSNGNELDEIVEGFLIEAQEIFDDLSNGLVDFEKNPEDQELINSIFRGFHTLKGTAGFLDFPNIEKAAHVMEDLLNQIRQGKRTVSSSDIDVIFEGMDILQQLLEKIQEEKKDDVDVTDFVKKLRNYLNEGEKPAPQPEQKTDKKSSANQNSNKIEEFTEIEIPSDSEELLEPYLDDTKDSIKRALEFLQNETDETEKIKTITQIIETIKGSSGFIGFIPLEKTSQYFVKTINSLHENNELTFEYFSKEFQQVESLITNIINDYLNLKKIKTDYLSYINNNAEPPKENIVNENKEVPQTPSEKVQKPIEQKNDGLEDGKIYEISGELKELVDVFFIELDEILEGLNQDFIELENNPQDNELLNRIFRGAHTIKGTSGFIGFDHLVSLTHAMEDCLNRARNHEIVINEKIIDILLEGVDGIVFLKEKFKNHEPISFPVSEYKEKLNAAISNSNDKTKEKTSQSSNKIDSKETQQTTQQPKEKAPTKDVTKSYLGKFADKTIRVDVERLDNLMDLVGELVLGRNRLVQILNNMKIQMGDTHHLDELVESTGSVDFLTTEIQGAVMMTRMVPVGRVFSKFPRLVRDLAREAGKQIEFKMEGEKTEVDKSVSEDIGDPLVHILRNSVDHGLETPEERKKAGKPETGLVQLNAFHEGNSIIIECIDDGRGINPEKVINKAIEKKVITPEEAKKLSNEEAYDLLFKPGFSTAEKVTNISGRGVGMDVVKTNIQKLSGIISIKSEIGKGTSLRLQLPLTLAIIQGLVIQVYEEIYIIPLASVLETYRLNRKELYTVKGNYVIRLRDEVLPIIHLEEILDIPHNNSKWENRYVVVIGLGNSKAGIVVDKLIGQKEIVIKTLGSYLGSVRGIGGCSILGDGRIRLIIDVSDLIHLTKDVRRK